MSDTTTNELRAEQLRGAALEVAVRELGGQLTDWHVTHEAPGQVVVKGWRGQRFGSFAASFDPTAGSVQTESYGTRGSEEPSETLTPLPATGAQAEAVARALDEWLVVADRDDDEQLVEREHVRAFRRSLAQQGDAA